MKAIDPVWKQYDTKELGYITSDQFKQLAAFVLTKMGYADAFDEKIFDEALS